MAFPDLRAFIEQLRRNRDLIEVAAPVDARLEAAEIHRRVIAAGGPALLFTNVEGADFPLVTNLFGTAHRAELAFGERPQRLIRRIVELVETMLPPTPAKLWGARDVGLELMKVGLRRGRGGPVTEVVTDDVHLDRLPALTTWSEDGGPFITLPLVFTQHPDGRGHNLGMYRLHVHDQRSTGMHWQIGKGGGFHYHVAEARGDALPATVFLGGPPALMLSAIAPLPENVPELMLASLIAGERLRLADGPWPHALIANAEFALIGEVPPRERRPEGPFGDHYGYYSLQHDYPVFHARTMARRRDAIYPATVVGKPRQEDFFIGDLLQDLLSPLFPVVMPAVEQLWSYGETGYHSLAATVVKQRYPREAMASAFRILGEGQLSLTKFLLVTDRPVDLRNFPATLEHVLARTNPETDLYVFSNLSMDTLDYTGPEVNLGSKGVWLGLGDAVRDLPRTFTAAAVPPGVSDVQVFCGGCLVVGVPPRETEPDVAGRIAADPAFAPWPMIVLSDEPARAVRSPTNFLWTTFTRFEPAADVHAAATRVVRNHLAYTAPVVIDARLKSGFPAELTCREDVAAKVDARWKEYFPAGGVEMGDAERSHLD
ncbi:MAG: UbiD family decarboxylase [Vicinamibacterales bacterium]|jgi:UbiD family decarboxylase|nr:4-hydroxybenzoate decarboxylase [Acidobacteriota bacterium]MDP7294244.1 UbiD family decarboxylase [Vicinamibacterales bacterium]MDP7472392.1 UbiD family decarboxylase [Vicinamibacterales bacterium]MDP7670412.1 UbiD family decarboxylase [Vicinamibacterales bacterium]HJO38070.1 UbiD family decarboxylase [Vicinamibacterales bacterium]|tara:strand:+ start:39 stop:1838 length:1800 start_codon:yes stop_codon:yes gene_type:complete